MSPPHRSPCPREGRSGCPSNAAAFSVSGLYRRRDRKSQSVEIINYINDYHELALIWRGLRHKERVQGRRSAGGTVAGPTQRASEPKITRRVASLLRSGVVDVKAAGSPLTRGLRSFRPCGASRSPRAAPKSLKKRAEDSQCRASTRARKVSRITSNFPGAPVTW
jgi:hypothetical protein